MAVSRIPKRPVQVKRTGLGPWGKVAIGLVVMVAAGLATVAGARYGASRERPAATPAAPATNSEDCERYIALLDLKIAGDKRWKEEERTGMPHATNEDGTPQTWADRQAIGSALLARKPGGCEL